MAVATLQSLAAPLSTCPPGLSLPRSYHMAFLLLLNSSSSSCPRAFALVPFVWSGHCPPSSHWSFNIYASYQMSPL